MPVPPVARIVFVNRFFHPDESATSQLLSDLAFNLAQAGYPVRIVCSRQRYDQPQAALAARERVAGVEVRRVWSTRFGRDRILGRAVDYLSFYVSCAFALLRELRRGDLVIAKTDPPLISIVAASVAALTGARLGNWLQDIFPEVATQLHSNPLPRPLDALVRALRNASLRRACVNIVLGERMREFVLSLKVAEEKIVIIENWADNGASGPKSCADSRLRARLGLTHKFVVGYSGNLGRAHEYQTVLQAAQSLQSDPSIAFLMIGAGAGMAEMRRAVASQRLDNVHFIPYQPRAELHDSLAAADVHWVSLLPSLEGLIVPSKAYGILAAGRPILFIGDSDGEIARMVDVADVGMHIEPGDAAGLARRLRDLQANPERCRAMGERALQLFRQRFTAQAAGVKWRELLQRFKSGLSVKPPSRTPVGSVR